MRLNYTRSQLWNMKKRHTRRFFSSSGRNTCISIAKAIILYRDICTKKATKYIFIHSYLVCIFVFTVTEYSILHSWDSVTHPLIHTSRAFTKHLLYSGDNDISVKKTKPLLKLTFWYHKDCIFWLKPAELVIIKHSHNLPGRWNQMALSLKIHCTTYKLCDLGQVAWPFCVQFVY
jgi:hypothetical protein